MEFSLSGLSQHGYTLLFAAVFLEAIGIPVPAAVALLIAGAASAHGSLVPLLTLATALSAMLLGDTLLFLMGRHTGWALLGLLCRLSLNPESCILRGAEAFYRRGRILLVFAKFVPGINSMAPPLAGSMNMRLGQFLRFDSAGASLYVGTYLSLGFLFNGAIETVTSGYHTAGRVLSWGLIVLVAGYLGAQAWTWHKVRHLPSDLFVSPSEAAQAAYSGDAVIYDVRSHGYYDPKAVRLKGSRRLDPNAFNRWEQDIPSDRPVYLYCTCIRELTSGRVARFLSEKGMRAAVIKGGLRAWKKAGLPLEPVPEEEISLLPNFES